MSGTKAPESDAVKEISELFGKTKKNLQTDTADASNGVSGPKVPADIANLTQSKNPTKSAVVPGAVSGSADASAPGADAGSGQATSARSVNSGQAGSGQAASTRSARSGQAVNPTKANASGASVASSPKPSNASSANVSAGATANTDVTGKGPAVAPKSTVSGANLNATKSSLSNPTLGGGLNLKDDLKWVEDEAQKIWKKIEDGVSGLGTDIGNDINWTNTTIFGNHVARLAEKAILDTEYLVDAGSIGSALYRLPGNVKKIGGFVSSTPGKIKNVINKVGNVVSRKKEPEKPEFLSIESFQDWPKFENAELKVTDFKFNGGMSGFLAEGIINLQSKTFLQKNDIPSLLGGLISLKLYKEENSKDEQKGVEYYLHVNVKDISFANQEQQDDDNTFYNYKITITSGLWLLTFRTNCRIFQKETTPGIVKTVLEEYGITVDDTKLHKKHDAREYCVQFYETDLNFVLRLLAAEGIFCYWRYKISVPQLVLADVIAGYDDVISVEDIKEINYNFQPFSTNYVTNSHDFTAPKKTLLVNDEKSSIQFKNIPHASIYDPRHKYQTLKSAAGTKARAGEDIAKIGVNDLESGYEIVTCKSNSFYVDVGDKLAIQDSEDNQQEYVVVYVTRDIKDEQNCDLSFTCIRADIVFSSKISLDVDDEKSPKPKKFDVVIPKIEGPQLARVIGPDNSIVHTDEYGRVQIKFYWDTDQDTAKSCWVRVMHSVGIHGVPNVGTAVVVMFEGGNPDKPLVIGQVCSGTTKSIVGDINDNNRFQQAIGCVSSHANGTKCSSIVLDHDKNSPELVINAAGKRKVTVGNGDILTVTSGDMFIEISTGKLNITTGSDITIESKGNLSLKGKTVAIESDTTLDIKANTCASITSNAQLLLKGSTIEQA